MIYHIQLHIGIVILFDKTQISIRPNRTLAFCNKDRLIADDTKEFELRRERFDGENLTPDQLTLADELETEQVNTFMKSVFRWFGCYLRINFYQ